MTTNVQPAPELDTTQNTATNTETNKEDEDDLKSKLTKYPSISDDNEQILFSCNICYEVRFTRLLQYVSRKPIIHPVCPYNFPCSSPQSQLSPCAAIFIAGPAFTDGFKSKANAGRAPYAKLASIKTK